MADKTGLSEEDHSHDPMQSLRPHLPELHPNAHSIRDGLTSQLGRLNPFSHPINPEQSIAWLFDNTAYHPSDDGNHHSASPANPANRGSGDKPRWITKYVAAYFVRRSGAEASMIVAQLARAIGLADDSEAKKTITRRLGPLLDQILPAKTAVIDIGSVGKHELVPSGPDGISKEVVGMPDREPEWKDGESVETSVEGGVEFLGSVTRFAGKEGWGVISDVDDTIKVTLTNSPFGILKTTFAEEPRVIEGMPEFYQRLRRELGDPPFWYLTASPYNLYGFLREFRDAHYPQGTMLLREASWMNLAGFMASISQNTQDYKVKNLDELHKGWPDRKMVCIGDSTQSDPEAYAEAYKKYPGWIRAIWIRKAEDVVEIKDVFPMQSAEKRNSAKRFEEAFEGIPKDIWHVFKDPKALEAKLAALQA